MVLLQTEGMKSLDCCQKNKKKKQSNERLLVSLHQPWEHLLDLPPWTLEKYQIGYEKEKREEKNKSCDLGTK